MKIRAFLFVFFKLLSWLVDAFTLTLRLTSRSRAVPHNAGLGSNTNRDVRTEESNELYLYIAK